jgi:Xaa-Pro aminopeptidase
LSTRSISPDRYAERIAHAQSLLPSQDASALLIGVGADLQWLTGYAAHALERLTMLVIPANGRASLVVPRLERSAADSCTAADAKLVDLLTWEETEDPFALVGRLLSDSKSRPEIQIGALGGAWGRLGGLMVSDRLWATFLLRLQAQVPDAAFGLASTVLSDLRAIKDAEEVDLLRAAALAADKAIEDVSRGRLVGRTEADIAHDVKDALVRGGHDDASFWIVASGPNSASPHHEPGDRIVNAGEVLLLDIGGTIEGYCSDITRTFWVTGESGEGPTDEFRNLYGVLQRAQQAQLEAIRPGLRACDLDAVGRDEIAAAGCGENFIHRTGHGIGLDGHEDPYIVSSNERPLEARNAFSIEPGIYLEGKYGARIEDIAVCTSDGGDVLNRASRDLVVVRGT